MSVHEPKRAQNPEETRDLGRNSMWSTNPRENTMERTTRWRSTTGRFRSLGLETLTTFPVTHDCLEEREEALRILAGFHGAYLVLKEVK